MELEGKDLKASGESVRRKSRSCGVTPSASASSSFPSAAAEGLLGPARRRNGHVKEEKAIGGQVGRRWRSDGHERDLSTSSLGRSLDARARNRNRSRGLARRERKHGDNGGGG